MKTKSGFTLIELMVLVIFLIATGIIFFVQKQDIEIRNRDEARKTAINSMYYNLEEDFFAKNKFYPEKISEENLKAMDPQQFTDPNGINIGEAESNYRYETADCEDGKCKQYTLRADLEKEDDFVKKSRN